MNTIKNFICISIGVIIITPIIFFFIPIRFTIKQLNSIDADTFYIIEFTPESNTEGGICYIIGDKNGIWSRDNDIVVSLIGENPKDYVASSMCNNGTKFIIYGSLIKEIDEYWGYKYTLNSDSWDIFQEINGGFHEYYMTIYDLKSVSTIFD